MPPPLPRPTGPPEPFFRRLAGVFRWSPPALKLVWTTSPRLFVLMASLTLLQGLLPAGIAWAGKRIIDAVVAATQGADTGPLVAALILEAGLVAAAGAARKGKEVATSLLRVQLGHRVNVLILDKALELELPQFEDSELYDQMTQARRGASTRPLSLAIKVFSLVERAVALTAYGALLLAFSGWAVVLLAVAALPGFVAETKFARDGFRLFRWRAPESRKQMYLESVIAREDYAKEVQLLRLGPVLLDRYRAIFNTVYAEDRDLTLRRGLWGWLLGLLATAALYGAYAWIALSAAAAAITLGDMTMYLLVFKQGQSAFAGLLGDVGGMYEDNLYLANLYEFLALPSKRSDEGATEGPVPADGIRFEDVSFAYPGAEVPAVSGVTLHIPPGRKLALVGHNGSGKTTLIKLLTRLYRPTAGRVLLDGLPLDEWQEEALRQRIGVIFQDFARYQFAVGDNIGVGEVENMDDRDRQTDAAERGMAAPFIDAMPEGYDTQLGTWFAGGRDLSIGQWQKVALSRAFMSEAADILVLDEPTSAMDAEAEAEIFDRVRRLSDEKIAVLISHRFSTVRMADEIVVLDAGAVIEQGTHEQLMKLDGRYATLFDTQAAGYQ